MTTAPHAAPDEAAASAATAHADAAAQASWREVAAYLWGRGLAGVRRVVGVVRPTGWVLIGTAAVLWIVGLRFGWREVTVAAVVVTAVLILCLLFLIGRTTYDVSLDLTRTRVVVGERAVGALTLANSGQRAILPSRVVLPVGPGRGVFGIRHLTPGEAVEELFAIPTTRRAVLPVGPVSIVRGDPLGLFERVDSRDEPVDLYVHPRTVRFDGQSLGFVRDLEGMTSRELTRDDIAFHALSEYQPGDDLRHVHWRSTARTGTLMVRTYEQTRRSHFVMGLSSHPAEYADPDEFELAVSAIGSLGLRALRDSYRVDVRTQSGRLRSDTQKHLLDALAGVEHTRPREGGAAALAGAVAAAAPAASIVVLACGSRVTAAELQAAVSRMPLGSRALVVVAARGEEPGRRRIGEADVITIGALEHLAPSLRRVLG
ncbi:DUF58 domain-containing protein [Microbacterium paludicola]|uniref:DUF58 domain-containing protein n=1 Tax=Microbacterium paludicola TaxID=300019 RepID=A0A4Y9FMU5_9MICO|nr:DUF58 domain-containing protein [Microbacterium paludicola]MBF0817616.1 DUF58 domain-containing protein [Microbacterium paludicola]TFU30537.1 DUF58 domain-containing protein [Microbacterium paludicola]